LWVKERGITRKIRKETRNCLEGGLALKGVKKLRGERGLTCGR